MDAVFSDQEKQYVLLAYYLGRQKLLNCVAIYQLTKAILDAFEQTHSIAGYKRSDSISGCCLCKEKEDIFKDFWEYYKLSSSQDGALEEITDQDVENAWDDILKLWMYVEAQNKSESEPKSILLRFEEACKDVMARHNVPLLSDSKTENSIWMSLILSVKKKLEACLASLRKNSEETEKIPDTSTVRHLEVPSSVSGVESVFKSAEIALKVENNPNMVARFVQRCRNQGVKVKPTGDQHLISVKYMFCSGCLRCEDLDMPLSILGVLEKLWQTCEDALHPDKKMESLDKSAKFPKRLKHQSVPDREKIPVANNKIFPGNGPHSAKLPSAKKVKACLKDVGNSRIRRSARLSGNPKICDNAISLNDENAKAGTFPHSPQQKARQRRTSRKTAEKLQIVESEDVAVTPQSKDVVLIPSNVFDTTATLEANLLLASEKSLDSEAMEQSSFTAPIFAPPNEEVRTKSIECRDPKTAVITITKSPRVSTSRKLKINQNDITELKRETAVTLTAREKRYKNVVTPSGDKSECEDKKKSSTDKRVTRNFSKNNSRSLMDKILQLYRIKKIPPLDGKNPNAKVSFQNKLKSRIKSKSENKSTIFSSVTSHAGGFPITLTDNPNHALEQSIMPKENTNAEVEQSTSGHVNKQQAQVTPPKVKKAKKWRSRLCMPPKKKSKNSVGKEELCAKEINAVAEEEQEKATRIQRSISEIVSLYISKLKMSSQVVSEIRNHCRKSSNSQDRSIPKPFEPNFLCSIKAIEQQSWSVYWYKRCSCSKTPDTASIPKVRRWNPNWIAGAMRADQNLNKSDNDSRPVTNPESSLIQDVLSTEHTEAFIGTGTEQKLNLDKDVQSEESESLVCVTNTVHNSTTEHQKPSTENKKDDPQNFVTGLKPEKLSDGRNGIVNNRKRKHDSVDEEETSEERPNERAINVLTSDPVQMKEDLNLSCCRPVLGHNQTHLRKPSSSHILTDPDSDVSLRIQPKRKSDEASPGRLKAKYRRDRDGNWSVLHSDVEELVSDNENGEKSAKVGISGSKCSQVLCVASSVTSQHARSQLGPINENICDKTKLQPLDISLVDISNSAQLDSSAHCTPEKAAEMFEYVEFKEALVRKTKKEQIHSEDTDLCTKSQFIFSCVYQSFTDPEYTIATPHPTCFSQYPKVSPRFSDHLSNASLLRRSPEKVTTNQNEDMEKDYASKVFSLLFNSNNYWTRNAGRKRTSLPMISSARQNKFASLRKKKSRKALRFLGKKRANTEVFAFTSPAKCTKGKTESEMGMIARNEGPSPVEQLPVDITSANLTDDIPLSTKRSCSSLLEVADIVQTETCTLPCTTNCKTLDTAEDNKENSTTRNETQQLLPQFPTNPVPETDNATSIKCSSQLKSWLRSRRVPDELPSVATALIQPRRTSTEIDHVEFSASAACVESVEPNVTTSYDGNDIVEKLDVEICKRVDEELLDVDDLVKDVQNRENIKEGEDQKHFGSPIRSSDNSSEFDEKEGGDETSAAKNLLSTWWGKLELFKEEEDCEKYQIPSFLKIYKDVKQLLRMHASEKLFTERIHGKRKSNLVINVQKDLGKRLRSKNSKLSKVLRSFPEVNGVKKNKRGRQQWNKSKVTGRKFKPKPKGERLKAPHLCKVSPKQSTIDQTVMSDELFHNDTKFAGEHQNLSTLPETCESSEILTCEDSHIPESFSTEGECWESQRSTKNHVQSTFFQSKNCSLICDLEVSSLESQSPAKNLDLTSSSDEENSSENLICSFDETPTNSTPQSPTNSHSSRHETDSANSSECDFKLGDVEPTSLEKLKKRKRGSDISGALNGMYWSNIMNPVQLGAVKEGRFLRKQRYANEELRCSLQEKGNKRKIPGLGHCLSSPKYIGAILDADKTSVHKLFQSFSDSEEDDFSDSDDSFASLFKSSLNVTRIRSVMLDSTSAKSFSLQLPHTQVASEPKLFKPFQPTKKRRMRPPWSPENTELDKAITLKEADEPKAPLLKGTQDSRTDYLNIVNQYSPSVSKAYVPLVRCPLPDMSSQMPGPPRTTSVQKIFFLLRHLRPDSGRPKGLSQAGCRTKPLLFGNEGRKSKRLTRRPLRWDGVKC